MARPADSVPAEEHEMHDDLRLTLRALDHEVTRLVGVIERVEVMLRGPRIETPAARPTSLSQLREDQP